MSMKRMIGLGAAALFLLAGCGGEDPPAENNQTTTNANPGGKGDVINADPGAQDDPTLCVGVRGNGQKIFAHFGALARIHEDHGMISAIAGGSSGSITAFLTESIYANENVFFCGDDVCEDDVSADRVALMYKSIEGYTGVVAQSDEVVAVQASLQVLAALKESGVDAMIANEQFDEAREAMLTVFTSMEFRELINQEVIALLQSSEDPSFHAQDVWAGLSSLGSFKADSDAILIRPGVIDFDQFARKIGRVGSFYAGYGPADNAAWQAFLDGCAEPARGKTWRQIATMDAGDGKTCGDHFNAMASSWREKLLVDEAAFPSRVDEPVGKHLSALVTTSVITGEAIETWKQARADYIAAAPYSFDVNYEDVRLGYWGRQADLDAIGKNPLGFDDRKSQMFLSLGQRSYAEALGLSPAEPGLARAIEISDELVSTGGWSDLEPTLVLESIGCEQVILVTREGGTQGFGADVSRLLGMTDEIDAELFDPGQEDSSVSRSLAAADGVICTNWDSTGDLDFAATIDDAYNAPLQTTSEWLLGGASVETSAALGKVGCTPGVGE